MGLYILKRLLLMIPTLLGIILINFVVVQLIPGGPVDQILAQYEGLDAMDSIRFQAEERTQSESSHHRVDMDQSLRQELIQQYGFDQPAAKRFVDMLWRYLHFDFGTSFYTDRAVIDLVLDKMPVSISLGLWTTLLVYLISIPLGIAKAMRDGSLFDAATSMVIILGYAIPGFLFAILLIVLFAGGSFWDWFPLRGLVSDNWHELGWWDRIVDYFWHLCLPILAMVVGGFASLTLLCKNSFIDEISKSYVYTARAKGMGERAVLYGHVFRNAMLIVVAGAPAAFVSIFFTGSLLIEVIFSLDGLGLLGFESVIKYDFPVIFATLYVLSLLGLVLNLIGDLCYVLIDPRIDFDARQR